MYQRGPSGVLQDVLYFMGGRSPLPKTRDMDFCVQVHWWTSRGYFRMTLES